jgi:hypothetical protein
MSAAEVGAERTFTGGYRRGWYNATWPLVKLTVGPEGIRLRPSHRLLLPLGVRRLDFSWAEIDRVEPVEGALPLSCGIQFGNPGKRLIWWCLSADARTTILAAVSEFAPGSIVEPEKLRSVF